jgi:hypothetical protein
MLHQTTLTTFDAQVSAPEGMVYSTSPHTAEGADGISYFVKGPDREVVFAELAGCLLAREVGLIVPDVAVCSLSDERYCGSRKVAGAVRNVEPWLKRPQKVRNFDDLYKVIVVDAWLANDDRNMGNVLVRPVHGSEVELVMIDFEKSKTLRPNPIVASTMVEARRLWPTGDLGRTVRERKPLFASLPTMDRIREITPGRCGGIIGEVVEALGPIAWSENSIDALSRRAERIDEIVGELWTQN